MNEGLALALKTVAVSVGLLLFTLGVLETVLGLRGEGIVLFGVALAVVGALLFGLPFATAFRDMARAAREGRARLGRDDE